jgi:succinate dehydrogenase hydrophobic anchor subunit
MIMNYFKSFTRKAPLTAVTLMCYVFGLAICMISLIILVWLLLEASANHGSSHWLGIFLGISAVLIIFFTVALIIFQVPKHIHIANIAKELYEMKKIISTH